MTPGDGALAGFTTDELRAAVRAVLRDVLPAAVTDAAPAAPEAVTVRSDADLDVLVRRVAALCDDPGQRAALKGGRRRFALAGGTAGDQRGDQSGDPAGLVRVDRGAVTERTVKQAAAQGARLVVGPKAVLTPLARDKARALGVQVEREER